MFNAITFSQSHDESCNLTNLVHTMLWNMTGTNGLAHRHQLRIKYCGERELLDARLLQAVEHAGAATGKYTRYVGDFGPCCGWVLNVVLC